MKVSHRITRLATSASSPRRSPPPPPARGPLPDPPIDTAATRSSSSPTPVVQSVNDGFDWASAAIGAGAAGGIILLIGVGGTTYRHRHEHIGVAR